MWPSACCWWCCCCCFRNQRIEIIDTTCCSCCSCCCTGCLDGNVGQTRRLLSRSPCAAVRWHHKEAAEGLTRACCCLSVSVRGERMVACKKSGARSVDKVQTEIDASRRVQHHFRAWAFGHAMSHENQASKNKQSDGAPAYAPRPSSVVRMGTNRRAWPHGRIQRAKREAGEPRTQSQWVWTRGRRPP